LDQKIKIKKGFHGLKNPKYSADVRSVVKINQSKLHEPILFQKQSEKVKGKALKLKQRFEFAD
jgi:hypothetical protein